MHGLHHAGNFLRVRADYPLVTCDHVTAALSARLGGEDPQAEPAVLDGHLPGCAGCRARRARSSGRG
ncbi:hypothetical protein D7147_14040 [Micromonospora musae]|uniref:Putative zinc-finger domain-containing protein n=1 Tax=Micromonospora musae TaxID=1894970 RepID=A0ABX9RBQ9_9ACTN|nr:hypothetical protein D7147_14040 [Micromonospora musae]